MHFTLVEHGELYAPEPLGVQSILLAGDKIAQIGGIDGAALAHAGVECDTVDARGCYVVPGFIDPHAHLIGAGGEQGFRSRMPEIGLSQLIGAGVTTVVGLLGTDTTTRYLPSLFAKAAQLNAEGINAFFYTGGFEIPPTTLTGEVTSDLTMIDMIIGTGEVAISDERWIDPQLDDLAHVVAATRLGGMMGGKAGVTHFHVGEGEKRLTLLFELLDNYVIQPECLYPTHITRSEALMDEAIQLAKRGCFVDTDTVNEDLAKWLRYYYEHGGPPAQLTASSDAHTPGGSPHKLYRQFVSCMQEGGFALAEVLPHFTSNVATALKLEQKGRLELGKAADLLLLERKSLELDTVFACGRRFMERGKLVVKSQLEQQFVQSDPSQK